MGDEPQFAREIRMAKVQGLVLAKTVTYDLTITEQEISIVGRQVREKPINGRISGPTLTLAHRVRQIVSYLKIHSFELVGNQSWHFTGVLHPMKVIPPVERSVIREGILRELTAPGGRILCRPSLNASGQKIIYFQNAYEILASSRRQVWSRLRSDTSPSGLKRHRHQTSPGSASSSVLRRPFHRGI